MERATLGQRFVSSLIDMIFRMIIIGLIIDVFSFKKGTTIGRRSQGTMVVDSNNEAASFGTMFARTIVKTITGYTVILYLVSVILVLSGKDALHDMFLKTKTVQVQK